MNDIIVGIGEVLWDVFPEGKRIGGAPLPKLTTNSLKNSLKNKKTVLLPWRTVAGSLVSVAPHGMTG